MKVNALRLTLNKISRGLGYHYKGLRACSMNNGYEVEFDGHRIRVRSYKTTSSIATEWEWLDEASVGMVSYCLRFIPEIKEKLRILKAREDGLTENLLEEAAAILASLGEIDAED